MTIAATSRLRWSPQRYELLRSLARRPAGVMALATVFVLTLVAALAPVIAPYNPNAIDVNALLHGPSTAHVLGTDYLGRDLLSRTIFGSRTAFLIALPAVVIGFVPGVLLDLSAGYLGGLPDKIAIIVLDTILSFPSVISYASRI